MHLIFVVHCTNENYSSHNDNNSIHSRNSLIPSPLSEKLGNSLVAFQCIFCQPSHLRLWNETMQNVIPSHAHKEKRANYTIQ